MKVAVRVSELLCANLYLVEYLPIAQTKRVYLAVKTCEVFLCFVAIARVRIYYVDLFFSFVLRHLRVLLVLTPRMNQLGATGQL